MAGNKSAMRLLCCPSPGRGWEENGKKKAKTGGSGLDKGSLTEQQTKGTATTTIQIRTIHNTNGRNGQSCSHRPLP